VTSLEQRGKPLGLFAEAVYESAEVDLRVGDRVVVFSDGVLEQSHKMDLQTLEQVLKDQAAKADSTEELWSQVTANVSGEDDASLLIVKRLS
jgi:serine phosphatase RsbU (regulator of sigma subunit)